jgi:DNA-binding transcriptional MocR family regulator
MLSRNADTYTEPQGCAPLREAIAKYTGFTRAVAFISGVVVIAVAGEASP